MLVAVLLAIGLLTVGCDGSGGAVAPSRPPDERVATTVEPYVEETIAPTPTPRPVPPAIELAAAVKAGKISITLRGENLQDLDLTLESKIETAIRVVVNPGTIFTPRASGTQAMVVTQKAVITLEAETEIEVELEVACAQMHDDTPTSKDGFRLASSDPPKDLVKLLRLPAFGDEDFRVQQFAIWTITDNPTRGGYVGLTSLVSSGGPNDDELNRIADLFAEAGIPAGHYRALR